MAFFSETPELPKTPVSPTLMLGAASPLWGYFGATAITGLTWWWMTRFTPQNLEAMFATASTAPLRAAEAVEETFVEEVSASLKAAEEMVPGVTPATIEAALEAEAFVGGGESAPFGPVAAELIEEEKPVVEAAPEPTPEPATAPKARRAPPAAGPSNEA